MIARETDVEALWGNLSHRQRQAVLGILLRDIAEAYRMSDDESKMQWSGPILELIEIGCRFTSQILPKGKAPSGRETQ